MKRIGFIVVCLAFLLAACSQAPEYRAAHTFETQSWNRFQYVNLEMDITNVEADYDVILCFRFDADFPFEHLYVNSIMTTPGGTERIRDFKVKLKDLNGQFMGHLADGVYEYSFPVYKQMRFTEIGSCKFELERLNPRGIEMPGCHQVEMVITPSKRKAQVD